MNHAGILPALACLALASGIGAQEQPNTLFILVDDLGWGDLPGYGGTAPMPALERLAAEGIRFTQAYAAAPICSPSRCGLLTGQSPQRHRIASWLDFRKANAERGLADWLDPAAPSLARQLQQAGYHTAQVGKWHLGGQRDVGDAPPPTAYGFASSLTQFEGLGDRYLHLLDGPQGTKPYFINNDKQGRGAITFLPRSTITGAFATRAHTEIDAARAAGRPFYIQLWLDDPHLPLFPPADLRGDGSPEALYRGVLTGLDRQLGPLLDRIRSDPQLRDNTLVVFMSDNGPPDKAGSAGALSGRKGSISEGGIRVPLIVWGPGLLAPGSAGTVNDSTVFTGVDLLPSLCAISRAPLPAAQLDGEDLSPALLGRSAAPRRGPACWMSPGAWSRRPEVALQAPPADLAIRDGDWKLVTTRDGDAPRLYDLRQDAAEANDLAAAQPALVAQLRTRLLAWHATLPQPVLPPR